MCGLVLVTSGKALRNAGGALHETFQSHVVVEDHYLGANTGIQPQTKGLIPSAGGRKHAELASVIVNRLLPCYTGVDLAQTAFRQHQKYPCNNWRKLHRS